MPRGPGAQAPNDEVDAGDSDEDDPELFGLNYYQCPPGQTKFNKQVAQKFFADKQTAQQAFYPPDVLTGRCDPDLIGLGICYVHAPHKSLYLIQP